MACPMFSRTAIPENSVALELSEIQYETSESAETLDPKPAEKQNKPRLSVSDIQVLNVQYSES